MKRFELRQEGSTIHLKILGAIDEEFRFPGNLPCETLIIDFDGLTLFNSAGIRSWLVWSREKKGFKQLKLENCRANFIDQAAYIKEIIPTYASVDSFYVPFYDEEADFTMEVKLVRGTDYDDSKITLPKPTDVHGRPLDIEVKSTYFEFLKRK